MPADAPADAMVRKLKALIAFRALFVTILLGSFLVFNIGYSVFPYPSSVLHLIVFLYALTIAYSLLLGRVKSLPFAYVQLCLDVASVETLIFLTGGIESWFSSSMLFVVIAAAIVINRKAGYIVASLGSILYGSLIDLQYYGVVPIPYDRMLLEKDFLYNIFSHILAFYLIAYLTGSLTSRLEKKDVELEKKELDLKDLSLFNTEVIENTPSGLFTTDPEGRVFLFNRAAEKITGFDRAEVVGKNISSVFPFLREIREQRRLEEEVRLAAATKVIGLTISGMADAKGVHIGFIGIFQDLTELKKMAEEIKHKEQLAAIGELAANVAHEIRNPLASLKGSVEMLREGALSNGQREKLMSIALKEMDRLNNIVTDFLSYSRLWKLEPESFDLHNVLEETMDLLRNRAGAAVDLHKEFDGPLYVTADPRKMKQVFWNLAVNAMDAMPSGGELTVGTHNRNGLVEITFSDTGTGISPENIEKVFYPFFTTKPNGSGFGLSIAYRIVEDHNGWITLQSGPEGTKFFILIPKDHEEFKG